MPVHDPALRFARPSRLRGWSVAQSPEQDDVVWATAPLNVSKHKTLSKSSVDLSLSAPLRYDNGYVPFDPLPVPDLYASSSASSAESTFSNLPPIPNPHPLSIASTQLVVDTPPLVTRRGSVLRPLPLPPTTTSTRTMNGTPSLRKSASFIHESRSYRDAQPSPYSFNPILDQHQSHLCWCQSQTVTNRAHTHSNSYTYGSASHSNLNLSVIAPSSPPPPPPSLPLYTRHDSLSLSYSHSQGHPRPLPIRPSTSQGLGSSFGAFGASDSNLPCSVAPVQVQAQPQVLRMGPRPLIRSLSKTRLLPPLPMTSAQVAVDEVMPNVKSKAAHGRMGSDATTTTTTSTMTASTNANTTRKSHKSKSSYDPSLLSSTLPSTLASTSNPEKEIRKSKSISKTHPQRIRSTYAIPGVDELVALLDSVEERERVEEVVTHTHEHGRPVPESTPASTSQSRSQSKPRLSTSTPSVPTKIVPPTNMTTSRTIRPRGAAPPALILSSTSTSSSTQHLTVPQTPLKSASSLSPAETIFSFFSSGLRSAGGSRGNSNGGFLGLSTKKGKGDEKDAEKEKGREWPGSAISIVDFEFPVPPGKGEEDNQSGDEDEEEQPVDLERSTSRTGGNGGVMRISYKRYHPHQRGAKSKINSKTKSLRGSGSKVVDLTILEMNDAVHVQLPSTISRLDLNSPTTSSSSSSSSVPPTPPPKPTTTTTTTTTPLMRTKDLPKLKINDIDLVPSSKLRANANAKPAWVTRKLDLAKASSGKDKALLVPSVTSSLSAGSATSNIVRRKSPAASVRSVRSGSGRSVRSVRSGRSTRSTTSTSSRARIQAAKVSAVKAQTQAKTSKSKSIFGAPSPTSTGMGKKTTMAIAMAKSRLTIFPGFTASKHDSTTTTTSITTSTPKDYPLKPKKRNNLSRLTLTDPRSPHINFKPVSNAFGLVQRECQTLRHHWVHTGS